MWSYNSHGGSFSRHKGPTAIVSACFIPALSVKRFRVTWCDLSEVEGEQFPHWKKNSYCDSRRMKRSCRDVKRFETSWNWFCGAMVPGLWGIGDQETGRSKRTPVLLPLKVRRRTHKQAATDSDEGSGTSCRINTNFLSTVTEGLCSLYPELLWQS